jgi:hydrogenase expression/formation protein HypE
MRNVIDKPIIGKFPLDLIEEIVYPRLGAHRSEILVGPGHGRDNAVIRLGHDQVLVVTADPLSIIPALGVQDSAWLSVNLLASDLATCGFPPQFIIVNLCLPPSISDNEFEEYWSAFHSECKKLSIAILGGHTGRYVGCDYTIIGGGVMMTLAPENQYLSSNMSKPGDLLIMTKGVSIATTGILARVFPETIEKAYGSAFLKRAQSYFHQFSVVKDALTAASAGLRDDGVTAMHDVTEGGLLGALYELSEASKNGLEIELADVIVTEEAKLVCDLFNIDPYSTLSEGTLIISVKPEKAQEMLQALKLKRIKSKVIGKVTDLRDGRLIKRNGVREALKKPSIDPYWEAYWKAYQKGLK